MGGDFGNKLAAYIICFFLLWVFFAFVVGAAIGDGYLLVVMVNHQENWKGLVMQSFGWSDWEMFFWAAICVVGSMIFGCVAWEILKCVWANLPVRWDW